MGNSDLTYPVATISVDEVMFAGGNSDVNNTKFYLYSGNYYWTLSPTQYTGYYANYLTVSSSGKITNSSGQNGYRPVISLKSDVLKYDAATSNGTMSYPFILK